MPNPIYLASLPLQVGALATGMRAYHREAMSNWRKQNPKDAAAQDAKKSGRSEEFTTGANSHQWAEPTHDEAHVLSRAGCPECESRHPGDAARTNYDLERYSR